MNNERGCIVQAQHSPWQSYILSTMLRFSEVRVSRLRLGDVSSNRPSCNIDSKHAASQT